MKKLFLATIAFVLLIPAATTAQDAAKHEETKPEESRPTSKMATLSGKVSDDATTLTTDGNVKWTISNPFMLTSFAGQSATVKGHPYKGENKIQVISATGILPDAKVVGNRDTSAYRR
ncbi:MAG: hypothetical protein ACRD59_01025 [Candidatus Acidiferrales bacterium]